MKIAALIVAGVVTAATPALAGNAPEYAPRIGEWGLDLAGRDASVRPQDDFFRYANGVWLETFEMPADLSSYGSFTELFLESEEQIREIVNEAASSSPKKGTVAQKVGDLYSDYVDTDGIEKAGMKPVQLRCCHCCDRRCR
jgi:predicted metalloendopeptidase